MTDNTNTERDAFEAWMHQEDQAEPEPERTYEFDEDGMNQLTTDCMWAAWKARASLEEKPERAHLGETYFTASDMATAPMPDLTALTAAGSKAWAGVDAQDLRDEGIAGAWFTAADMATAEARGFRDGQAAQAAEGQEPAARVNDDGFIVETGLLLSPGMKLYAATQPAVAAGWVSVDERLPGKQGQDSEEVMLFINGHCASTDFECRQGGAWGIRLGYFDADIQTFRVHGRPHSHVTHWMPLPPAPSTKGEINDRT